VPRQAALDGTCTPVDDSHVDQGEVEPPVNDHRQAVLPLPEPWHDGSQLRLDVAYLPPTGAVRMTLTQYQEALAASWESLAQYLAEHNCDKRDVAFALRRAREVPECSRDYLTPKCECGHLDHERAHVVEGCDSRTCPICGRRASKHYRSAGFNYVEKHPVSRVKGKVSRGYYLSTTTDRKPEVLTVDGLRASVKKVKKASGSKWKNVARYLPRKKEGRYRKYPGKCADAGMLSRVELGPHGNIHAHELRYGAYHYSEDLRAAADGVWTHDTRIRQDDRGARGGVVEALKYVTKASTKPGRREFTHPALAVLFEFAVKGMRLVEGYGTMRGILRQAEESYLEERQGVLKDEAERTAELPPCPCCGRSSWTWVTVTHERGYVQPPRKRAKPPPDG